MLSVKNNQSASIEVDYIGNIYLKCNDKYYIIMLDISMSSGIDLVKINNPDIFKNNLINSHFTNNEIKVNNILPVNTLHAKINETLNVSSYNCIEETYFSTEEIEDYDEEYIFNGSGIGFSDLLSFRENSFNTILIQGDIKSKEVISFIERADKFSPYTLIVYTSGIIKVNCDEIIFSQLSYESNELVCVKI